VVTPVVVMRATLVVVTVTKRPPFLYCGFPALVSPLSSPDDAAKNTLMK